MFLVLLLSLFFPVYGVFTEEECPLPLSCNDTQLTNSLVEKNCTEFKAEMTGKRCCYLNTTIIGLDLRYCEIKKLNVTQTVFSSMKFLDLRDNEYDKLTSQELIGLLNLDFLYLPLHIPCPGGASAWNETFQSDNMTSCQYQLDMCKSLNISCGDPSNAGCVHTGPGSAKCMCSPGHFGYKCLNEAEFPVAIFSSSVIIPTIVLSIVLWFVQGRDPHRIQKM